MANVQGTTNDISSSDTVGSTPDTPPPREDWCVGVVVNFSGEGYGGNPYILVQTATGTTFIINREKGPGHSLDFTRNSTIHFVPTGDERQLRAYPGVLRVGIKPLLTNVPIPGTCFIRATMVTRQDFRGGRLSLTKTRFHERGTANRNILVPFYNANLGATSIWGYPSLPVLIQTCTKEGAKDNRPSVVDIRVDVPRLERTFKNVWTRTGSRVFNNTFGPTIMIGGHQGCSPLPCWETKRETT